MLSSNSDFSKLFYDCKEYIIVACQNNKLNEKVDDLVQVGTPRLSDLWSYIASPWILVKPLYWLIPKWNTWPIWHVIQSRNLFLYPRIWTTIHCINKLTSRVLKKKDHSKTITMREICNFYLAYLPELFGLLVFFFLNIQARCAR